MSSSKRRDVFPKRRPRRAVAPHAAEANAAKAERAALLEQAEAREANRPRLERPRPWPRDETAPRPVSDGAASLARDVRAGVYEDRPSDCVRDGRGHVAAIARLRGWS